MDKHMQHAVFHTIAFLAFSCLAFSTLASWCRKFMSRIFHPCDMVPHFHVPQFHVSHFQRPHASAVLAMGLCLSVCVCLSVRLSQVGVLLKRLNVGSHKQHYTIVQRLEFPDAKDFREIRPGSPPTGAPNAGGVGQNRRLLTNSRLYLENGTR